MAMKSLLSDLPKKTAIVIFRDGTRKNLEGCQGHWDEEDVIHLCYGSEEWGNILRVFFILSGDKPD